MYSYNKEKQMFVFTRDLTEYLLKYGISIEHINKMKNKILETNRDAYQDFAPLGSPERDYDELVPLDKVIGTSRGTSGLSVYENVRMMHMGSREPDRFMQCLSYLDKMPLEELRKSYEKLFEPVQMVHYVDDDEYYVTGDGNHRTLTAMLVGAECISAKVTNAYCNIEKKEKFFQSKEFEKKYKIVKIMSSGDFFDFYFKDDRGIFEICGYPGPRKKEKLNSFLERTSKLIDNDIKKVNRVKKMPVVIQEFILHFEKNNRIEQYLHKKYASEGEYIFWKYRSPVTLYNL